MGRRVNQVIACLLAACLALAGVVGLSPDLHRLLEHGGKGPAHTHAGIAAHVHGDETAAVHRHGSEAPHQHPAERAPERLLQGHGEFALPTAELAKLWRFVVHVLAGPSASGNDSSPDTNGHHHDSLTQLLAGGLVDLSADFSPLTGGGAHFVFYLLPAGVQLPGQYWNAQTYERGPPASSARFASLA